MRLRKIDSLPDKVEKLGGFVVCIFCISDFINEV